MVRLQWTRLFALPFSSGQPCQSTDILSFLVVVVVVVRTRSLSLTPQCLCFVGPSVHPFPPPPVTLIPFTPFWPLILHQPRF
ncbi:hypothetical protein B0O80DRAFT_178955 [Mortierella sp. GBAus27b]|nr:hypothetical protein B0O80DRAFT_178955 [Mortierella sp. GBAus27b]